MTIPEKWIKAQDGSLVNLNHITRIVKKYIYREKFAVHAFFPGIAFSEGTEVENYAVLTIDLSEDEADKLISGLAVMLGLTVFHVSPLLDAIRGTLPDMDEDGEETEAGI